MEHARAKSLVKLFETTVTTLGKSRMIGFGNTNSDATHTDIDYAIFMHRSGALELYQDGSQAGSFGRYAPGDVLRIEITDSTIDYSIDTGTGAVIFHSHSFDTADFPFQVDVSMQDPLGTIDNTILFVPDPDHHHQRCTDC